MKKGIKKKMKNQREFLFLWHAKDTNPNGDLDADNMPRMDANGFNLVTDVRIKRTIRDYWLAKGRSVLIRQVVDDKGIVANIDTLVDMATENNKSREAIIKLPEKFLDTRVFGGLFPLKPKTKGENRHMSFTGPVQMQVLARSLNKPNVTTHSITSSLSSGKTDREGKVKESTAGTIGSFSVVDNSWILAPGKICPKIAEETGMTEEEVFLFYDGLWNGIKFLHSRSKYGQVPYLLLSIVYKDEELQIGDLVNSVSMTDDFKLDLSELIDVVNTHSERIEKIEYKFDNRLELIDGVSFDEYLKSKTLIPSVEI